MPMALVSSRHDSSRAQDRAGGPARPGRPTGARRWTVLIVLLLLFGLRSWVAEPVAVDSDSMAPTLRPGDHLLVEKLTTQDGWKRGDLLAFEARDGVLMVKRLVGQPGDRIAIRDGILVVNGHPLRESYVDRRDVDGVYFGPLRVPPGHLFLLGDSRGDSIDSRRFGAVPVDAVLGRVTVVLWPPGRAGSPSTGGAS